MALTSAGLSLIIPSGTARYIALGTGTSFTELTAAGYARKSHSSWVTLVVGGVTERTNSVAIIFNALTNGAKGVAWWGIYDAAVAGNLLATGPVLNLGGEPQAMDFAAGDQPRFNVNGLKLIATPEEV